MSKTIIENILSNFENYLLDNPELAININKKSDDDYYNSGLHCSTLDSCKRQVVMNYFKFPREKYTLQQLLNFARGNFYHELFYQFIKDFSNYEIIDKEKDISEYLPEPFKGKFDICFKDVIENKVILADIKTANSNQFKKYSNFLPQKKHIKQLSAYWYAYKNINPNVDLFFIIYFSNGNDKPQIYNINPLDVTKDFEIYIRAINDYQTKKKMPPILDPDFNKDEIWQCSYCQYLKISCEGVNLK